MRDSMTPNRETLFSIWLVSRKKSDQSFVRDTCNVAFSSEIPSYFRSYGFYGNDDVSRRTRGAKVHPATFASLCTRQPPGGGGRVGGWDGAAAGVFQIITSGSAAVVVAAVGYHGNRTVPSFLYLTSARSNDSPTTFRLFLFLLFSSSLALYYLYLSLSLSYLFIIFCFLLLFVLRYLFLVGTNFYAFFLFLVSCMTRFIV